jgi:RNA polymerase sigma-70 factor (sigma-E family)
VTYDEYVNHSLAALSRFALMLTTDRHTAADLVQETMVRARERWHRVSAADSPDAYVRRMLTNLYLDWHRGPWLRRVRLRAEPAETASPHDHAQRSADRDEIWQTLSTLPRQQRAALVLRYYEDRPDQEIADILGCSAGAVRGYISKALATLRARATADLPTGGSR